MNSLKPLSRNLSACDHCLSLKYVKHAIFKKIICIKEYMFNWQMWKEQKVIVTTHYNSDLIFPLSYL